jgi:hypothetical protein
LLVRSGEARGVRKSYETPTCNPLTKAELIARLQRTGQISRDGCVAIAVENFSEPLAALVSAVNDVFRSREHPPPVDSRETAALPVIIILNSREFGNFTLGLDGKGTANSNLWSMTGTSQSSDVAGVVTAIYDLRRADAVDPTGGVSQGALNG